jgi:hypothetical protein
MVTPSGVAVVEAPRVVAVVVTHNRQLLLSSCLRALRQQTIPPETILVVDNASTDGTASFLAAETEVPGPRLLVHRSEDNLGGAGGFALGVQRGLTLAPAWLWLMDDDSEPEPEALARLLEAAILIESTRWGGAIGFLASRVLWKDGAPHRMNVPGRLSRKPVSVLAPGLEPVDYASFVSLLVSAPAAAACGLPIAEFFIGSDDVEYTLRLTRAGYAGYHVEASRVKHLTRDNTGMKLWRPEVTPGEVDKWALKTRNLVAVNRRRTGGWFRESARMLLLPLVWWWHGVPGPVRHRLVYAGWSGLFWRYEKLIRFADAAPGGFGANSSHTS